MLSYTISCGIVTNEIVQVQVLYLSTYIAYLQICITCMRGPLMCLEMYIPDTHGQWPPVKRNYSQNVSNSS